MAVVTNPFLLIPVVAGLLALTQTVGDAAFNVDNHVVSDSNGIERMPANAAVSHAPDGSPVLLRIGTPLEEMSVPVPLTCLQLQVIDEIELISEVPHEADCD